MHVSMGNIVTTANVLQHLITIQPGAVMNRSIYCRAIITAADAIIHARQIRHVFREGALFN